MDRIVTLPHLDQKVTNLCFEEEKMQFDLTIDSGYHDYLNEHIFDNKFYVPGTFIVEIFMEAAQYYLQKKGTEDYPCNATWEMEDVEILRAIKRNPGEKLTATCIVNPQVTSDGIFGGEISIHSDRLNKAGKKVATCLNARCKVKLKQENSEMTFETRKLNLEDYRYYDVDSKVVYQRYYSGLGRRFKNCSYKLVVNKERNKMHCSYNCNGNELQCINQKNEEFLTSPLGNDACLQYAIFLSRLNNGLGELPVEFEKIHFLRKPSDCSNVNVYIEIRNIDDEKTYYDIYSYDNQGLCVYIKNFVSKKTTFQTKMESEFLDDLLDSGTKPDKEKMEVMSYYEWKTLDNSNG